ncbi:MAG: hypothetical protein WA040_08545 [Anaerolineae bacterium]
MSNDMQFRTSKATYQANPDQDYLGGGQTADVYRVASNGQRYALKLLTDRAYEQRFFQEVDWLIDFMTAPSTYGLEMNGRRLVPKVYDQQRSGEQRFFVMDLAPGQPLDQLLRGQPGYLSERDALTLAEQLCRVFTCLHEELRRSYLDFQPRNVFWDAELRQIMVIDWNLLSEKGKADVAADQYVLGRLLYRLAVGVDLPRRGLGEASRWGEVSLGTQLILQRALHRNPARRYAAVEDLRQAIERQLERWSMSADALVQQAGKSNNAFKSAGEGAEKRQQLEEAAVSLDMATRVEQGLSPKIAEMVYPMVKQQVDAAYDRSKPLEEGKHQITLGKRFASAIDYEKAVEQFRVAFEEAPDFALRLQAARWLLLAQAGAQGAESFSKHQDTYLKALALMEEQEYAQVVDLIDADVERAGGQGIVKLKNEAQAWLALDAAQRQGDLVQRANPIDPSQWQAVADQYSQVLALTAGIEHQDLLFEEWGDVAQQREPYVRRAVALREGAAALSDLQALLDGGDVEGIARFEDRLARRPGDVVLLDMCLKTSEGWIGFGRNPADAQRARDLLDAGLRYADGQRRGELEALWRKADAVVQADQVLQGAQARFDLVPRSLDSYRAAMLAAVQWSQQAGDASAVEQALREQMSTAWKERDLPAAEAIAQVAASLPGVSFSQDVDDLRGLIERDGIAYGEWLRGQVAGMADPELVEWRKRVQQEEPLGAMAAAYADEVQAERQRQRKIEQLTLAWQGLNQRLAAPTADLAQMQRLAGEYQSLMEQAQQPDLWAGDLIENIKTDQAQVQARIDQLQEEEHAEIERRAREAEVKQKEASDMAPILALWAAAEALRDQPGKEATEIGLLRDLATRTKQPPISQYAEARRIGQQAEATLRAKGVPVLPPAQETSEAKPVTAPSNEPVKLDPAVESRLGRKSWVASLVSALLMGLLLLGGGFLLARTLEPSEADTQAAATQQARAIQAAVAESFTQQQRQVASTQTAEADATRAAVVRATQQAEATATQEAALAAAQAARETAAAEQATAAAATAEAAPAATATAEALAIAEALAAKITNDFAVVWPSAGATAMAVAPWEFVVQNVQAEWPAGSYTLLLNDQPIYQFPTPVAGAPLVYTRSIEGPYDGWPGVSDEVKQALGIQANGELPAGTYQLQVALDENGDGEADRLSQVGSFIIDPAARLTALVQNAPDPGRARLEAPGATVGKFSAQGIRDSETVEILGKLEFVINNAPVIWYFWQAPAGTENTRNFERRGWTEAEFLKLDGGKTPADVPFIALPPAVG